MQGIEMLLISQLISQYYNFFGGLVLANDKDSLSSYFEGK